MFQTQKDPIGTVGESESHFPVRVEVPCIICWFNSVRELVSFNVGETIGAAVGGLLGPWAKRMSLVVTNALDPSVTERFPDFSNLIMTWAGLDGHVLTFIEPWWSSTFIHIREDPVAVGVEQFRDCRNVEVKSAVVENFDSCRSKSRLENSPFHNMYVIGAFGG